MHPGAGPQLWLRDPGVDFGVAETDPLAVPPHRAYCGPPGPYLAEHLDYLSLHLGNSTADGVHSVMDRRAPLELVFSYTRIMAGFTRFHQAPRWIGIVGLGGGSLVKHCLHQWPHANVQVAEISSEVIALRNHFLIPADDARFSVWLMDGVAFVDGNRAAFDVLLIDAFDEGGHLPRFSSATFFQACDRALRAGGVLVLNLSGEAWKAAAERLSCTFPGRTVLYTCPDGDNVIAFATKGKLPAWLNT